MNRYFWLSIESFIYPLRWANLLALLIHGLGHGLALALVRGNIRVLSLPLLTEGWTFPQLLASLKPSAPFPQFSPAPPHIPADPTLSAWASRCVAIGGMVLNLLSIVITLTGLNALHETACPVWMLSLADLIGGYFVTASFLAMLSLPDLLALIRGRMTALACGPAFAIRYRLEDEPDTRSLVSERLAGIVEILAREASTRGGQSGGFSVLASKQNAPSIIFDKAVKGKREDIVSVICQKLASLLAKAEREGYRRPPNFEAVLLHLRYATGGATHWHNAQPHWYEHYESMMHHRVRDGTLTAVDGEVFNMIAHNGDMDGVYLEFRIGDRPMRHFFTQPDARKIFLTAMPWTSSEGNSDSRSVAEWVDFVHTQGLAYKALRYAYFTAVLDFNRDIVTGNFDLTHLTRWAETVDLAMVTARRELGPACVNEGATSLADCSPALRERVKQALAGELAHHIDAQEVPIFVDAFEAAFFHHDLAWVMRRASRDMVGEFALMVCTTLEPRMGIFSLTQAFSVGHNLTLGEIFGSAEPLGVTTALQQGDPDEEVIQIYLEDGQYALIEFSAAEAHNAIRIYDRAKADDDLSALPQPNPKTRILPEHSLATLTHSNWFAVNNNPKIQRTRPDYGGNEVARDLKDIPFVLKRVVESFKPGGENEKTFQRFAGLLFQNLLDNDRDPKCHDLVLYGVDFNQDLAGEFSLAMHSILPGIRIRAENSGNVLKEMKRTVREGIGRYGPKTIFLGLSNSAQTQSTLAVVRKARDLVGAERCFVLTQNLLNSMSEALGQAYQPDAPILHNTFMNLSHLSPDGTTGRRRAEAATVVLVATQAVLTEILMGLAKRAIEAYRVLDRNTLISHQDSFELRQDLQMTDLKAFREFQAAIYFVEIPNRVGANVTGEMVESPDTLNLEREADARAENQIEFVRAYALFAAYIVMATVFGAPVFAVLLSPLDFIAGVGILAHLLDSALFLSALWLIHLAIRFYQKRPLFERIGSRAEVYIDRKYIARIVERYNATLFSNTPAFVTPYFYWADTVQDALHRYGIRAHRGVVTVHRTPDEHMGIEEANNAAEENMVYAQLGGIRFNGGQPQSRDKVRENSCYRNSARPYQTVLSDSLSGLRARYDKKLSPEVFRLINRRLIDLSDGLVTEFVIGFKRREKVHQAVWEVIRWIPGSTALYQIFLQNDLDLKNLGGEADTANQAQIQSTKHPVSPMDIHGETLQPRSTFDALRSDEQTPDESYAVLTFFRDHFKIDLNRHALLDMDDNRIGEIILKPGKGENLGFWVSDAVEGMAGAFTARLQAINGEEYLVVTQNAGILNMTLPLGSLDSEQRRYLTGQMRTPTGERWAVAA